MPYADLVDPQSLNQYSYVRNIPTSKIDADGHDGSVIDVAFEGLAELVDKGAAEGAVMIAGAAKAGGKIISAPALILTYLISPGTGSPEKNPEVEWEVNNAKQHQKQQQ